MEYDYSKYENILIEMLKASWRDPDDLEIGVDISDLPEVKITKMYENEGGSIGFQVKSVKETKILQVI